MPGFVDVSNMTAREIRMMDHAADADETVTTKRTWKPRAKPEGVQYTVDLVWGAAVAAQRVNGSYVKETVYRFDEAQNTTVVQQRRNRDVMTDMLANPSEVTAEDIRAGQECRNFLQNDITFRALKNRLTEFDGAVSKVLAVQGVFDTAKHRYELSVVACLPASHARALQRQTVQDRVAFARGGLIGQPGAKVQTEVEVVSANFSTNYNCWFLKGITKDDQPVFFSYREGIDAGTWLTIQGTVKAHRDNLTQLNRVKVL